MAKRAKNAVYTYSLNPTHDGSFSEVAITCCGKPADRGLQAFCLFDILTCKIFRYDIHFIVERLFSLKTARPQVATARLVVLLPRYPLPCEAKSEDHKLYVIENIYIQK